MYKGSYQNKKKIYNSNFMFNMTAVLPYFTLYVCVHTYIYICGCVSFVFYVRHKKKMGGKSDTYLHPHQDQLNKLFLNNTDGNSAMYRI